MISQYPKNSAGRKMIDKSLVPLVSPEQTTSDALKLLQEKMKSFETINYLYVVDQEGRLIGVVSIKELFLQLPETKIFEIMKKNLVVAHPTTHQERVAVLALKNNLKAIPIVNKENHFLGVVPSDTILSILHNENVEDALLSAGIHKFKDPAQAIITAPAFLHFKKRLPWLIFGLIGGMIAAFVVSGFEEALKVQLILVAFIPAIVYMADAVGAQTQTIFIRSLAIDHKLNFKNYLWREIRVGLALALVLGMIIFLASYFWQKSLLIGLIVGISFFLTILTAIGIALILPLFFSKIKLDPAITSGPFATVVRDILSLLIYFAIASLMLRIVIL